MTKTVTVCPACGSDRVVPIVFGFPGADTVEDFEAGRIELGGCVVTDDDPQWACRACDAHWG